jgi:hypothetical protein
MFAAIPNMAKVNSHFRSQLVLSMLDITMQFLKKWRIYNFDPCTANPVRFGTKCALGCTVYHCRLYLLALTIFLELSFVSPYNHLLFLAKTNKENDNNN